MRTLPLECADEDIRRLVVEWWELIVAGRYQHALEMFAHDDSQGIVWTPETLEEGIATGCCMSPPSGVPQSLFAPDAEPYDIFVYRDEPIVRHPKGYVGIVHFEPLPMKPYLGVLTASFHMMKVGRDQMTLEFDAAHVM